jgi:hypothetical protein
VVPVGSFAIEEFSFDESVEGFTVGSRFGPSDRGG